MNDEEETLLSSIPHHRRKSISLVQYRSNSFFQWERFLVKSHQVLFIVVFLLPLIGMQNLLHSVLTHILRADILEFLFHCGSNSSQTCLIHEKFWRKSECCLCLWEIQCVIKVYMCMDDFCAQWIECVGIISACVDELRQSYDYKQECACGPHLGLSFI